MHVAKSILQYVLFLQKEHDLALSIHFARPHPIQHTAELHALNIHTSPYCIYLKTCPGANEHCVEKQYAVFQKAKSGPYCGCCHAGIREYVFPFPGSEDAAGFISVSGYRAENGAEYLAAISQKYGLPLSELQRVYSTTKTTMPDPVWLETVITPLVCMLQLATQTEDTPKTDLDFPHAVEEYIRLHYTEHITSADICRHFSCSRSYMSTQYNATFGKGIRDTINDLRLADALALLKHFSLSVTEIALSVGFNDSNYFTALFQKKMGMSPLTYRRLMQQPMQKHAQI